MIADPTFNPASSALRFEAVTIDRAGVAALTDITAEVPKGGCTCIVGPNGAGKTTLLLAFLGQIPYRGRILGSASHIGYVPQRLDFDRGMPLSVSEFLSLGQTRRPLWLGLGAARKDRVRVLLAQVGAAHLAERRLGALSGGEVQRVVLAQALQHEPELLILDEPAAGVDFVGERLFCELLDTLRAERGFTQVMVTHDLGLVQHHASHVILLNRRLIAEGKPQDVLKPAILARAYGLHMGTAHLDQPADTCACSHHHGLPKGGAHA